MAPPPPVGSDKSPFDVNTSGSTHIRTSPEYGNGGQLSKEMFDRWDPVFFLGGSGSARLSGAMKASADNTPPQP